ncbi:MAG: hypothetical protein OXF02_02030 [Simkaniaceae bacterium]|nr:hypothetical protein [Simkaniaceae bacterium]
MSHYTVPVRGAGDPSCARGVRSPSGDGVVTRSDGVAFSGVLAKVGVVSGAVLVTLLSVVVGRVSNSTVRAFAFFGGAVATMLCLHRAVRCWRAGDVKVLHVTREGSGEIGGPSLKRGLRFSASREPEAGRTSEDVWKMKVEEEFAEATETVGTAVERIERVAKVLKECVWQDGEAISPGGGLGGETTEDVTETMKGKRAVAKEKVRVAEENIRAIREDMEAVKRSGQVDVDAIRKVMKDIGETTKILVQAKAIVRETQHCYHGNSENLGQISE